MFHLLKDPSHIFPHDAGNRQLETAEKKKKWYKD
jgi:hypothetical protein